MRSTAYIINVGRADVVNEEALYRAVANRRIAGAALDVWYRHPRAGSGRPSNLPFWELDNVVLTPHSSSTTTEVFERRVATIARNVDAVANGTPLEGLYKR